MNRSSNLKKLQSGSQFDLLIIGAGATGLGIAVEAASRGYSVGLLEKHDWAYGTSSRSTKLVHGGVRYLKQGNVGLVRDALRERGRLAQNAPHLVRKLSFVIPVYKTADFAFYGIGLKLYDLLSGRHSLGPSEFLSKQETLERLPNIRTEGLVGGVLYYDGQFDDARLAVTLARTAHGFGACLATKCEVISLLNEGDRVVGVVAEDEIGGAQFAVRGAVVINATGTGVDALRAMEDTKASPLVAVSQGIHLVLPREILGSSSALMVPKTDDGRVLFAIPWHGRTIVGTTDTPRSRPSEDPRALEHEAEFVVSHTQRYLVPQFKGSDVLSIFAGQRPLVRKDGVTATARLARDHTIEVGAGKLVTVTGGKWTTYRSIAEDTLKVAAQVGGLAPRESVTADMPLHGAGHENHFTGVHPSLRVYGTEAGQVLASGAAAPVHQRLPYLEAEVRWAVRQEMALSVEDVLSRRTRALILDAQAAREAAPKVAKIMAEEMSLDSSWVAKEVAEFDRVARRYCYTDAMSRDSRA